MISVNQDKRAECHILEGLSAMEFPVLVEVNPGRVLVDQASHLGTTTATYAIAARGIPILIVS